MPGLFALVDMDAFYVSAEQVFDPRLRGKPVGVLSNGDGNVVSRSREAKALGVAMGQPAFQLRDLVRSQGLILRSSNYSLYGDMSARVHTILREYARAYESYSIDEAFLHWPQLEDRIGLGQRLRTQVLQWCGIPCRVGYGPTKTLAKLANRRAKLVEGEGVVDLSDPTCQSSALAATAIEDVWGIGARWGERLRELGITTALALRDAPAPRLRQHFGVVVERTQRELQGHSCLALDEVEPDRQQILCSRTFGTPVSDEATMAAAIATHVSRAAERMRDRGLAAAALQMFFHTSGFRRGPQWSVSCTVGFASPCDDTRVMLSAARELVATHWKPGIAFAKAGVGLLDLVPAHRTQGDLFAPAQTAAQRPLMAAIDRINQRFGRNTLRFGAQALVPESQWQMRQAALSPHYTTRWSDVLKAV